MTQTIQKGNKDSTEESIRYIHHLIDLSLPWVHPKKISSESNLLRFIVQRDQLMKKGVQKLQPALNALFSKSGLLSKEKKRVDLSDGCLTLLAKSCYDEIGDSTSPVMVVSYLDIIFKLLRIRSWC